MSESITYLSPDERPEKKPRFKVTPEYRAWRDMKSVCLNRNCEKFVMYGGRGIKVCTAWAKFDAFLKDMGRKPSAKHRLSRKGDKGHFEPGNVEWRLRT